MAGTAVSSALLEICTYRLRGGTTEAFHATVVEQAAPLLREFGVDSAAHYAASEPAL